MGRGRPKVQLWKDSCKNCGEILDPTNIYMTSQGGMLWTCRNCYIRKQNRTPETKKAQAIKERYGLSMEEFNRMKELQLNVCAICKEPCNSGHDLSVDHNHTTGQVRGLLCKRCNLALGYLREDEGIIKNMLEYIKRYESPGILRVPQNTRLVKKPSVME